MMLMMSRIVKNNGGWSDFFFAVNRQHQSDRNLVTLITGGHHNLAARQITYNFVRICRLLFFFISLHVYIKYSK